MHDNDIFRIITPDDAVGLAAVIVVLLGLGNAFVPEPTAIKGRPVCDVTVAQYAPGERWAPNAKEPQCAGDMASAPNYILTHPIVQTAGRPDGRSPSSLRVRQSPPPSRER